MHSRLGTLALALLAVTLASACETSPAVIELREQLAFEPLPSIDLRLVLPAEDARLAPRYVTTATRGFRRFGEWLAPFPETQVTIVGGSAIDPHGAEATNTIVARTPWIAPARGGSLELSLMHAIAGAFVRASGAPEGAVLTDALVLYVTIKAIDELGEDEKYPGGHAFEQRYFGGHIPYVFLGITVRGPSWLARVDAPAPVQRAVRAMLTLERVVGWGTFQQAMTVFYERLRSGPADIDVFQRVLEEVSGRNLRWFMDEAFRSTRTYDYGVETLRSQPDGADPARYATTVIVRRYGDAMFAGTSRPPRPPFRSSGPLEVVVTFADGSVMRERWDGRAESMQLDYESRSPAVAAAIDPDHVLQLDDDRANNRRTITTPRAAAATWALRWAVWLQDAMLSYTWAF